MSKRIPSQRWTVLIFVTLPLLLMSCPNLFSNRDLKSKLEYDVAVETAREYTLTITVDSNGISTPSGAHAVKENIPFTISTTPFTTHAFMYWEQTGGSGTATFEDATSSTTVVSVVGGDVTIAPIFEAKPKVLYSTPIGKDIPKNSRVTIVFSKDVDPDTVTEESITITENGVGDGLSGQFTVTSNMVRFTPDSPFNAYRTYVITVLADVADTGGIALIDSYTNAFKTGNTFDNEPPTGGTFIIDDGVATHTASREVTLNNIFADDDSEIPTIQIYDESDFANVYMDFASSVPWTLSPDDGLKTIFMNFQDQIGNETPDPTTASIILDTTPPEGSIAINGGDEFTDDPSVALSLTALDPAAGTEDGSGMGSGRMLIGNDATFSASTWDAYAENVAAWSLSSGDGLKNVYLQLEDSVGNQTTTAFSDSIYLDTTAPTGTVNGGVTTYTNTTTATVSLELTDGAGIGVDTVRLQSSDVADGTDVWSSSAGNAGDISGGAFTEWTPAAATFTLPLSAGQGNKTITFGVRDELGNEGTVTGTVVYDTTVPTLTGISINSGATETNDARVTVTINGAADNTGAVNITHIGLTNDDDMGFGSPTWVPYAASVTWTLLSSNGIRTVNVALRDAAGNVSAVATDTINLDTMPPDGNFIINDNATFVTGTAVTLTVNGPAGGKMRFSNDGITWSHEWANAPAVAETYAWTMGSGDGLKTVYGQFRDSAGNDSPVTTDTITLDTAAPAGTITILGTGDGTNVYTNTLSPVSVSVAASDAGSGLYRVRFSMDGGSTWTTWEPYSTTKTGLTLANPSGSTYSVHAQVTDKAGNTSSTLGDSIVYDNTRPTISAFSINSGSAWTNNGAVTLNSTAADGGSGLYQLSISNTSGTSGFSAWETYTTARSSWSVVNPTTEGTKQVWIKVRDKAGNEVLTAATDSIGLDKTVPVISSVSVNAGAAATPFQQTTVTITASDSGGSGLYQRQQYYNGQYGTWGSFTSGVAQNVEWTFSATPGTHYVYVKVKDAAGNESSWVSDYITLEVPVPLYAWKGYSTTSTKVYFTPVTTAGTTRYRFYYTTVANANPNAGDTVTEVTYSDSTATSGYLSSPTFSSTAAQLRYYFVRAWNTAGTQYGPYSTVSVPGWSGNITVIYDANDSTDTALANAIKSRLETSLSVQYPSSISGTQPTWKVILIPESMVATSSISGTTDEAYYRHVIYGDPTIVTPGTSIYLNANQTRNLVGGYAPRGVIGMGFGGTKMIDTINSQWSSWGLSGTKPVDIGYLKAAGFSDATPYTYTWTTGNSVWTSPLSSTSIPGHNSSVQLSYQDLVPRYSVYRSGGVAPTDGVLYSREPSNTNYFPVVRQGRFMHFGYGVLPDRPYTGGVFLVNLMALMDNY